MQFDLRKAVAALFIGCWLVPSLGCANVKLPWRKTVAAPISPQQYADQVVARGDDSLERNISTANSYAPQPANGASETSSNRGSSKSCSSGCCKS